MRAGWSSPTLAGQRWHLAAGPPMPKQRVCKECEPRKKPLDAPYTGPRCYRHHKARERELKAQAHARYVGNVYGLPPGFYDALYEHQGGRCAWCNLADGGTRKLAV